MKFKAKIILLLFLVFSFSKTTALENNNSIRKELVPSKYHEKTKKIRFVKFLENKGQMIDEAGNPVPNVLFKCEAPGLNMYITQAGITYQFFKLSEKDEEEERKARFLAKYHKKRGVMMQRVDMNLKGSSIKKENIIREKPLEGHFNYFYSHCPEGIYNVKQYEKITITDIYPGIDWVFYNSSTKGFKYDFIVHKGADPGIIEMLYLTSNLITRDAKGDLLIREHLGKLTEKTPLTYYSNNKEKINSTFSINSQKKVEKHFETSISFSLQNVNMNSETFVIDPDLEWSTFFGGNGNEGALSADTDTSGNLFITGYVASVNFPLLNAGTYYQSTSSVSIPHIVKFSNSGVLLWATFYGSTSGVGLTGQKGNTIAIDLFGNVFVAGVCSSTTFPVQNASTFYQGTSGGLSDIFILKFGNSGNRLWATYYGGSGYEEANSIAIDAAGNLFVTGYTTSTNFPLLNNSTFFQGSIQSLGNTAFILKFNNTGSLLLSTYFGNGAWIRPVVKVDNSGNMYLSGTVSSITGSVPLLNPGGGAYYQNIASGQTECYISKFSNGGNLLWSTYYGGSSDDFGMSMAKDNNGNIFICGATSSGNFPLLNAGTFFQGTLSGAGSGFISKFGSAGNLLWATLYNGFSPGQGNDNLEVDSCGNVYMSGTAGSSTVQTMYPCNGTFIKSFAAQGDVFLTRFSNSGDLYWASYFGGDGNDFYSPLALDKSGNLFVAGEWTNSSINYPTLNPGGSAYYNASNNGSDDIYVAKFLVKQLPEPKNYFKYEPVVCLNGQNLATITPTIIIPGGSFSASPSGLIIDPVTGIITVSASTPGTYSISYGNFSCGCYNNVALTNTFAISIPALVTISNASVCAGNSVMLSVTASPSVDLSYSWSVPSSNSASLVISPSVSSTYTATITNSLGCKSFAVASVTVNALPTLTITGNNAVCPGQSLSLNASGALTYTWNIGSNSNIVTMIPTSNFVYSVSGSNSIGCIASTTVIALIKPLPVISINIPTVCLGDQSVLTITSNPSSGVNYTWMPSGSQSSSLLVQVFSSTTYTIFSNLDGCVKLDSIRVIVTNTVEPITKFTYNSPYCIDSQNPIPILSEGFASGGLFSGVSEISLNQSSGTVDLNNSLPGNYQITYSVDRVNCTVAGTSTALIVIDEALKLSISKDKKIIPGSSTTITASGGDTYTWTPDFYLSCSNCTSPIANPPSNTKYCVQSKRNSCLSTACVNIEVACKGEEELIIANAFTPNGDNKNDKFCLQGWDGCIKQFSVMIFDRWGEKVFESNDPAFCWDGTYKGTLLNAGVYVYAIDAHYEQDLTIVKKGNITLIR